MATSPKAGEADEDPKVAEPEVIKQVNGHELTAKTHSLHSFIAVMESADEQLADPNFDPKKFVGEFKDKIDGCWKFEVFMKERRETYKKEGQKLTKTGTAMERNLAKYRQYIADCMAEAGATSYPGHLKRVDLQGGSPEFHILEKPTAQLHLSHPELCKAQVTTTYYWDVAEVQKLYEAEELDEEISVEVKPGKQFIKFFNNANADKSKGVKSKKAKPTIGAKARKPKTEN